MQCCTAADAALLKASQARPPDGLPTLRAQRRVTAPPLAAIGRQYPGRHGRGTTSVTMTSQEAEAARPAPR